MRLKTEFGEHSIRFKQNLFFAPYEQNKQSQ